MHSVAVLLQCYNALNCRDSSLPPPPQTTITKTLKILLNQQHGIQKYDVCTATHFMQLFYVIVIYVIYAIYVIVSCYSFHQQGIRKALAVRSRSCPFPLASLGG